MKAYFKHPVKHLINTLERRNDLLEEKVIYDGLTNCYNKSYISHLLEEAVLDAKTFNRPLSLLLYDYDHFKQINDRYGHLNGDIALVEGTRTAVESVRENDSVGRFGGEEFMVIMPDVGLEDAGKIAERIRYNKENADFQDEMPITISGGLIELKDETATALIKKADLLLYASKTNGRNRITEQ